jgi:hypothetical protein
VDKDWVQVDAMSRKPRGVEGCGLNREVSGVIFPVLPQKLWVVEAAEASKEAASPQLVGRVF